VNAGTNEEKTEDSSSAVHIKKVTFFLQETVSTIQRMKFFKTLFYQYGSCYSICALVGYSNFTRSFFDFPLCTDT
jgi:hypothetical protein